MLLFAKPRTPLIPSWALSYSLKEPRQAGALSPGVILNGGGRSVKETASCGAACAPSPSDHSLPTPSPKLPSASDPAGPVVLALDDVGNTSLLCWSVAPSSGRTGPSLTKLCRRTFFSPPLWALSCTVHFPHIRRTFAEGKSSLSATEFIIDLVLTLLMAHWVL